jgi:hypothetical protein
MLGELAKAVNPAGGLIYHARAARYRGALWAPFREAIGDWLEEWGPRARRLVIFGPSGGYCLPMGWVGQFDSVVGVDPDPVAEWIFRRRLGGRTRVEWRREDFFRGSAGSRLKEFLEEEAGAAILFANFLGQLRYVLGRGKESDLLAPWRTGLSSIIEGREWASFHDRVSGALQPRFEQGLRAEQRLTDAEMLARFYAEGESGELIDHQTDGLLPEALARAYFSWELAPGQFHLVEAVRSEDLGRAGHAQGGF